MAAIGLARQHGLDLAIVRPFSVFGEGQHPANFFPALKAAALAGQNFAMTPGEQIRDFIPVETVAGHFLHIVEAARLPAGSPAIFHSASGIPRRLSDFASEWWQRFGATGRLDLGATPYRDGELMRVATHAPDFSHLE